jgi:hypothetical protein
LNLSGDANNVSSKELPTSGSSHVSSSKNYTEPQNQSLGNSFDSHQSPQARLNQASGSDAFGQGQPTVQASAAMMAVSTTPMLSGTGQDGNDNSSKLTITVLSLILVGGALVVGCIMYAAVARKVPMISFDISWLSLIFRIQSPKLSRVHPQPNLDKEFDNHADEWSAEPPVITVHEGEKTSDENLEMDRASTCTPSPRPSMISTPSGQSSMTSWVHWQRQTPRSVPDPSQTPRWAPDTSQSSSSNQQITPEIALRPNLATGDVHASFPRRGSLPSYLSPPTHTSLANLGAADAGASQPRRGSLPEDMNGPYLTAEQCQKLVSPRQNCRISPQPRIWAISYDVTTPPLETDLSSLRRSAQVIDDMPSSPMSSGRTSVTPV